MQKNVNEFLSRMRHVVLCNLKLRTVSMKSFHYKGMYIPPGLQKFALL